MSGAGEGWAERLVSAPWGEGAGRIPRATVEHPPFGEVAAEQLRRVPAPLQVRLDPAGGVHVLSAAGLHRFDPSGRFAGAAALPPGTGPLADFAPDPEGACYLLERGGALHRLRSDGTPAWSLDIGPALSPGDEVSRLRMDGRGRPFLAARGVVGRVDPATGRCEAVDRPGLPGDKVFVTPGGELVYAAYFAERNRRGIVRFDPAAARRAEWVGGAEDFGWLVAPLGVDAAARLYCFRGGAVARFDGAGGAEEVARLGGVAVRGDGAVFLSRARDGVVEVHALLPDGGRERRDLALPPGAEPAAGWRLVRVDDAGRLHLHGDEAPGSAGTLLVYSADGTLQRAAPAVPAALEGESRLQGHTDWQVDAAGRLYLPVADGAGFHVVRLAPP